MNTPWFVETLEESNPFTGLQDRWKVLVVIVVDTVIIA
jgi:hypothetical protein